MVRAAAKSQQDEAADRKSPPRSQALTVLHHIRRWLTRTLSLSVLFIEGGHIRT